MADKSGFFQEAYQTTYNVLWGSIMPAYYSLSFELNKSPDAIRAFCEALIHSGLVFKSGYYECENDSFKDIITRNQSKLDGDFVLRDTEHPSHDYGQMLFDYCDFSEVRLFVMNSKKERTFSFELIVPEDDLLDYIKKNDGKYSVQQKAERMEQLKSIAKKMWASTATLAIQTGWEGSDIPPSAKRIARGMKPQAEPFCIINSASFKKEQALAYEYIERGGVLIEDATNWNY